MINGMRIKIKSLLQDEVIHTDDLPAILKTYKITPPEPYLVVDEIPGTNWTFDSYDRTYQMYGPDLKFKRRPISFSLRFIERNNAELQAELLELFHAKNCAVAFDDDPLWWFNGRLMVDSVEQVNKYACDVEFSMDAEPYRIGNDSMTENDWLWDELDLKNGVIGGEEITTKSQTNQDFYINVPYHEATMVIKFDRKPNTMRIDGISVDTSTITSNSDGTYMLKRKVEKGQVTLRTWFGDVSTMVITFEDRRSL